MNAKLPLPALAINDWLRRATTELADVGISSAKLDAEIILAHTIRRPRTYLHAHGDEPLTDRWREIADARLRLRLNRTPVAYIIGHKEFYGRRFQVTPATLIPRPESETIIELLKEYALHAQPLLDEPLRRLVDVGTGSGCLGITAKLELPELDVTLLDVSQHALVVAEANAKALEADVTIVRSDLLSNYPLSADYVLANLPYVDTSWERSPETNYEPALALFADDQGLALIAKLLKQLPGHLAPDGLLLCEADPRQHPAIIKLAKQYGLSHRETRGFIVSLQKTR
jgi:release factor glutamine methyltransferase